MSEENKEKKEKNWATKLAEDEAKKEADAVPNWKRVVNGIGKVVNTITTQINNELQKKQQLKALRRDQAIGLLKPTNPPSPEQIFRKEGAGYDPENPMKPVQDGNINVGNGGNTIRFQTGNIPRFDIDEETGFYRNATKEGFIKRPAKRIKIKKIRGDTIINTGFDKDVKDMVGPADGKLKEVKLNEHYYQVNVKCFNCQETYTFGIPRGTMAQGFLAKQPCKKCGVKYLRKY
ncbi:MAG: hypothetical protein V3U54_07675 [Thermodesulfobacteriota bacterium]